MRDQAERYSVEESSRQVKGEHRPEVRAHLVRNPEPKENNRDEGREGSRGNRQLLEGLTGHCQGTGLSSERIGRVLRRGTA